MPVHSIGHSLNPPLLRIYTSGCCGDSRSGWRERWCCRSQRRRSKQQSFNGSNEKGRMVLKKREKVESPLSYGSSQEAKNGKSKKSGCDTDFSHSLTLADNSL